MERFVSSAPLQTPGGQPAASPSSFSPLSTASFSPPPSSLASPSSSAAANLPPIPFSAITSGSGASSDSVDTAQTTANGEDYKRNEDDDDESDASCELSERELIARGKHLLQAYQIQKKQWLAQQGESSARGNDADSGAYDGWQTESSVSTPNIFQSPSGGRAKTIDGHDKHSPQDTQTMKAPNGTSLYGPLPPSSVASGLSTFSIGPPPTSNLKLHNASALNASSEKSWSEFTQLLRLNRRTLDAVDEQMAEIWGVLVNADEQARGPQSSVSVLSRAVTQLLQQKREVETAIAKVAEVLGSRALLTGKLADDAVQFVTNQLKLELEASQALICKLKAEHTTWKPERDESRQQNRVTGSKDLNVEALLRQQLKDKDQKLQASQATVAKLEAQLAEHQQATAAKNSMLERSLAVKMQEIDALCSDVALPGTYERETNEQGVVCFRRKDSSDEKDQLEDPRVAIAIEQHVRSANSAASASGGIGSTTSNSSSHRPQVVSSKVQQYAARDNAMRRSLSTPHISHELNAAFEDIHVPPDDGRKHTIEDFSTPLPAGWEMRVTTSGAVFFFNKYTATTTWTDPRLTGAMAPPSSALEPSQQPEHKPTAEPRGSSATTADSRPSRASSGTTGAGRRVTCSGVESEDEAEFFDVVFQERGPIGIHFQANVPDSGATVRSLLPDMAAADKGALQPYDELVAVNKNAVDEAPFRHVMLLLQGGLRPLTLTFRRGLKRPPSSSTVNAATAIGNSTALGSQDMGLDLDEEVVCDEGSETGSQLLRVPTGSPTSAPLLMPSQQQASHPVDAPPQSARGDEEEDLTVADVIITNIFSMFWRPPEPTAEVQTV